MGKEQNLYLRFLTGGNNLISGEVEMSNGDSWLIRIANEEIESERREKGHRHNHTINLRGGTIWVPYFFDAEKDFGLSKGTKVLRVGYDGLEFAVRPFTDGLRIDETIKGLFRTKTTYVHMNNGQDYAISPPHTSFLSHRSVGVHIPYNNFSIEQKSVKHDKRVPETAVKRLEEVGAIFKF